MSNDKALAAFAALKGELDQTVEFLKAISDDHFNAAADDVNWGHVGTLQKGLEELRQAYDRLNDMARAG